MTLEVLQQQVSALSAQVALLQRSSAAASAPSDGVVGRSLFDSFVRARVFSDDSAASLGRWRMTAAGANAVSIAAGSVFKGSWYHSTATTVAVTGGSAGSPLYIYASINLATGAITVNPNAVASLPSPGASVIYFPLHTVYESNGTIVTVCQNQMSDIILVPVMP